MKNYRVKEVKGKFIPQKRKWYLFFFNWQAIDETGYLWSVEEYQKIYCSKDTLEEAKEIINNYKQSKIKYYY